MSSQHDVTRNFSADFSIEKYNVKIHMIEIVSPSTKYLNAIKVFFNELKKGRVPELFSPHPFEDQEALRLCTYKGKDIYSFLITRGNILGYGMLQGWDEGEKNPSLGICIHPKHQGKGFGMTLMHHLIDQARQRQAHEILVKVKKDNPFAIALFKKMGFTLNEKDSLSLKGSLDLTSLNLQKPKSIATTLEDF